MTSPLAGPFFEIGPKNLLRRAELERLVGAAGEAGAEFGVTVVVTVPTALIAPIVQLRSGVRVFAQGMTADRPGPSMGTVIAESLVEAGADGVMLNHDSNPLDDESLARAVGRAHETGLGTILVTASVHDSVTFAGLEPSAILYEPPELIGTTSDTPRHWIAGANLAVRRAHPRVLMMHAGGVGTPGIAREIMAAGADGTGSTSGVLFAGNPLQAARQFIAAARTGWDDFHRDATTPQLTNTTKEHDDEDHS